MDQKMVIFGTPKRQIWPKFEDFDGLPLTKSDDLWKRGSNFGPTFWPPFWGFPEIREKALLLPIKYGSPRKGQKKVIKKWSKNGQKVGIQFLKLLKVLEILEFLKILIERAWFHFLILARIFIFFMSKSVFFDDKKSLFWVFVVKKVVFFVKNVHFCKKVNKCSEEFWRFSSFVIFNFLKKWPSRLNGFSVFSLFVVFGKTRFLTFFVTFLSPFCFNKAG